MSEQAVYVENELLVGRLDKQDYFRGVLRAVLAPQDDDAPPFLFFAARRGGHGQEPAHAPHAGHRSLQSAFEGIWNTWPAP